MWGLDKLYEEKHKSMNVGQVAEQKVLEGIPILYHLYNWTSDELNDIC